MDSMTVLVVSVVESTLSFYPMTVIYSYFPTKPFPTFPSFASYLAVLTIKPHKNTT